VARSGAFPASAVLTDSLMDVPGIVIIHFKPYPYDKHQHNDTDLRPDECTMLESEDRGFTLTSLASPLRS